jgi:putative transposase
MPYIKVNIHFVWSTKFRIPHLDTLELRTKVWRHIFENARLKGIHIDFVNGYSEHCHCLVSLGSQHSISTIMQLIKGESAYWINKNQLTKQKFEWQDEYFALSVLDTRLEKTRKYIENQEKHHSEVSWKEEEELLIKVHGFEKLKDNDR